MENTKLGVFIRQAEAAAVVVSSRNVAENFEKKHKNVLQAIENLECSEEFARLNFQPTSETVAMPNGGTRQDPAYDITRDGFTLLAMGFTGKKAMQFKEAYIKAFGEMERQFMNSDALQGGATRNLQVEPNIEVPVLRFSESERLENLARAFIGDCCEEFFAARVLRTDFYFHFNRWCRAEGVLIPHQAQVTMAVNRLGKYKQKGLFWFGLNIKHYVEASNCLVLDIYDDGSLF